MIASIPERVVQQQVTLANASLVVALASFRSYENKNQGPFGERVGKISQLFLGELVRGSVSME